jgi:hypothetical protein
VLSKQFPFRLTHILLLATFLLAACSIVPGNSGSSQGETDEEGTPVPTPTRDPSGYQAVPAQACLVADWAAMQTDRPQGDLIAWQPGTTNLAYIAPAERSSWYTGDLILATGPDFQQKILLAPDVLVNGDLTWSPGGSTLAFLAYRPNEAVYTIMIVRADGSGLTDLFPTDLARTDGRTSQKAILDWKDENTLEVITSCGEECRLAYALQVNASPELIATPVENYHELGDSLQIHRNIQDFNAKQFPKAMSDEAIKPDPNWSPTRQMVAYLDRRGLLWLLITGGKIQYLLDIGLRDVYETQWASGSDYLAIRAEDRAFIFQIPCEQNNNK